MDFYTVIEKQLNNGTPGTIATHYDDYTQALASFFTICAAAAVSTIEYHAAHVIRSDGVMIEGRVFDRRVVPGPEPEPGDDE